MPDAQEWIARGIELAVRLYERCGPFSPEQLRAIARGVESDDGMLYPFPRPPAFQRGVALGYRIIAAGIESEGS